VQQPQQATSNPSSAATSKRKAANAYYCNYDIDIVFHG